MAKMDGNHSSIIALCGMTGLIFLQNQACQTPEEATTVLEETSTVLALLGDVGPNVILPTLQSFVVEMEELQSILQTLQGEIDSGNDASSTKEEAQQQWLQAMSIWQQLEVMQVGPAGSSLRFVAGQDIRDEIYSWPTINACRIDQKTADVSWQESGYFEDNLVNAYGLDALEHLLFGGEESVCPSQVKPNSDGSWAALGADGVATNRVQFAAVLVDDIIDRSNQLNDIWSASGENFSAQLSLNDSNSPYESADEALNQVYNALFYLETATKDKKLAIPLGYKECSESICPENLEGLASSSSLEFIIGNLEGFRLLFTGGEGTGYDDLLDEMGHGDLSSQILQDIDATLTLAEGMDKPLEVLLETELEKVEEFYDSLALVTTALKVDMATVLHMTIPVEASGDND